MSFELKETQKRKEGEMWDQWDTLTNLTLGKEQFPVATPFSFSHCGTEILVGPSTRVVVADYECSEV